MGIFHRLNIRDRKPEYLKDVPRVLEYIHHVLDRHADLENLRELLSKQPSSNKVYESHDFSRRLWETLTPSD